MAPTPDFMRITPLLLLIGALAAAACDDGSTEPADDLRVMMTVAPTSFRAGEAVTVTVTVANTGSVDRKVALQPACPQPFTVQTPAGADVGTTVEICNLMLVPPRNVPAGGSVAVTALWRGGPSFVGGSLAPGEYVMRGVATALDPARTLRSEPVTVRVVP